MITKFQVRTMLDMQAAMNAKVNPHWVDAGYPFLRAVVVEGSEAMDHHGWKWWKAQTMDLAQLQMELVDIWHFTLSHIVLSAAGNIDVAAESLFGMVESSETGAAVGIQFDGKRYSLDTMTVLDKLELLIGLSVSRRISIALFSSLLRDCEMDWGELSRQYVMKNVLNFFRQDYGYKEGTYRKVWAGREDNEHLVEIVAGLDPLHPDFRDHIYGGLQQRYEQCCATT